MTSSTAATPKVAYLTFFCNVDKDTCGKLVGELNQLVTAGFTEVHLLVSTNGGDVMNGFTVYNTLRALPLKVITHNMGTVASIGVLIFLAGAERDACPNSTFVFHGVVNTGPSASVNRQQATEALRNIEITERRISAAIAERTSLDTDQVDDLFRGMNTKDTDFALDKKMISKVSQTTIPRGVPTIVIS